MYKTISGVIVSYCKGSFLYSCIQKVIKSTQFNFLSIFRGFYFGVSTPLLTNSLALMDKVVVPASITFGQTPK